MPVSPRAVAGTAYALKAPFTPHEPGKGFPFWTFTAVYRVDFFAMAANPPKHFSMLRQFHLADVLTLRQCRLRARRRFLSMLYMGSQSPGHFFAATAMTPAALAFDWLDGRVARWRASALNLGRGAWIRWPTSSRSASLRAVLGFAAGLAEDGTGSP